MKNPWSRITIFIIVVVLICGRFLEINLHKERPLTITTWDAFGYYVYNPALFIYHDHTKLEWLDSIDKKYSVTGGAGWQAQKADNGNYVFKYLGGVAIMQMPFFFIGHSIAKFTDYPEDGFSAPYQYSLTFGALLYCFLALLVLRKILLLFFDDRTTAITLLLLTLASNLIQYASVDASQSHIYIFFLYALILLSSLKWHEKPTAGWAFLTGYIIGLATISRPTEAIMLFIPLLWNTHTKAAAKEKWAMVKQHKGQIIIVLLGGLIGILPQILYWKSSAGTFIYDVGSKWVFLNPYFRVLFGFEKGWFIYTPVTILFVAGFFFIKKFPFRKSVLWFCLLNIWIIIAWDDWLYGGGYSTRALVQSYPVFALALAAVIDRILKTKWKFAFYLVAAYLLFVNLFQFWQYNTTVLHFRDMNRQYYSHIYLNPSPSPLDMSLLDTDEWLADEKDYRKTIFSESSAPLQIHSGPPTSFILMERPLTWPPVPAKNNERWLKVETTLKMNHDYWDRYLVAEVSAGDSIKKTFVRLFNPMAELNHQYGFYMRIPDKFKEGKLKIYLESKNNFDGVAERLQVTQFDR